MITFVVLRVPCSGYSMMSLVRTLPTFVKNGRKASSRRPRVLSGLEPKTKFVVSPISSLSCATFSLTSCSSLKSNLACCKCSRARSLTAWCSNGITIERLCAQRIAILTDLGPLADGISSRWKCVCATRSASSPIDTRDTMSALPDKASLLPYSLVMYSTRKMMVLSSRKGPSRFDV